MTRTSQTPITRPPDGDAGRLSRLITPVTRTSEGKKIDVWRVFIAGRGMVDFEIRMHLDHAAPRFEATTQDPDLRSFVAVRSTDIADLQRLLERAVEDFAETRYGTSWPTAVMLECGLHEARHGRYGGTAPTHRVDVQLQAHFVRAEPERPGRNSPLREVLSGDRRLTILERGRTCAVADLDLGERDGLSGRARVAMERDTPVSRAVLDDTPDLRRDLRLMTETLRQFGMLLSDRLSPSALEAAALGSRVRTGSSRRLPSPEDMVALMESAAQAARAAVEPGSPPGTGFENRSEAEAGDDPLAPGL